MLKFTNDYDAPADWTQVLFRNGYTPFSDNVNANVPELTMARARECVEKAAGRPIVVNVEEVLPEHRRIATLNAEIKLIQAVWSERGQAPSLLIPYGVWGETDYEARLLLPVFNDAGCVPIPLYIANPPNRTQGGTFHGTTIGDDIRRATDNAQRWRDLLPDVPRIAWVMDQYVFPALDKEEGGGTAQSVSDQDFKLLQVIFRHTGELLTGAMYWRATPYFDPRFAKLGGAAP